MAAKLLYSLTDDNPDLQKQIGCMTGIFKVFERHHAMSTRRLTNKRLPPPGNMNFNNGNLEIQSNIVYHQSATDMSLNRITNEKQILPVESSRGSSSSCSSLSSLDCNKTIQPETSSFDRMIFPEAPSRDPRVNQQPLHVGWQAVDLRHVVKDSMYREARGLSSMTTTKDGAIGCGRKQTESPQPMQLLKTTDESRGIGTNGKQNVSMDLQESVILAKLREAPWYFDEPRELPRSSSYEARDGISISKDAPRFSYDGRERNRASFESRDTYKSTPTLKEMPRHSPNSWEGSRRGSNSDSTWMADSGNLGARLQNPPHSSGPQNRPPTVVAKLMGLEAFPFSTSATDSQLGFIKTSPSGHKEPLPKSLKTNDPSRPIQISFSPRNSLKDPTSQRRRNPDSLMKPISISRLPTEPAPWKQVEPKYTIPYQNPPLLSQRNPQSTRVTSMMKGADFSKTLKSPIVIMKPAKTNASSVTPIYGFSGFDRIPNGGSADTKRSSDNDQMARDRASIGIQRVSAVSSSDKKANSKNVRSTQSPARIKPLAKENGNNSVKSSWSGSPRMQQKKLEMEKRSRPPMPPSFNLNKPRQNSSRQLAESGSPGGKLRPRSPNMQQNEDQMSEISNESRTMSYQGADLYLPAENNSVIDLQIDIEVSSPNRSTQPFGRQSPTGEAAKKSNERLNEKVSSVVLASAAAAEHWSPVSVLDASVYRYDELSPGKHIPNCSKGDWLQSSKDRHGDDQRSPVSNLLSNNMESGPTSEINRKKLQNIEHLVQRLRRLNSNHDESSTDYIASLCENTNPDHRYISEILLASGILLRDLGPGLTTFQLHPSGHPISPELFFVLEQTKASTLLPKEDFITRKVLHSKPNPEKFHRKLIFDVVNEILVEKLNLGWACDVPWLKPVKLANRTPIAQKLLKELCAGIEKLQAKTTKCTLEEEDDGLKSILWEYVMHQSESWTDVRNEISALVLDVERSIFKELVDEIVIGGVISLRAYKQGRRRQLFPE